MDSEFTTFALLVYSFALIGVFAFPKARARVNAVVFLAIPWAAALLMGALASSSSSSDAVPYKCSLLEQTTNASEAVLRSDGDGSYCYLPRAWAFVCGDYYVRIYPPCPSETPQRRRASQETLLAIPEECKEDDKRLIISGIPQPLPCGKTCNDVYQLEGAWVGQYVFQVTTSCHEGCRRGEFVKLTTVKLTTREQFTQRQYRCVDAS